MTVQPETNEPNEYGFGGGATGPTPSPSPSPDRESAEDARAESIAVPGGDLTEGIVEAIERDPDESGKSQDGKS